MRTSLNLRSLLVGLALLAASCGGGAVDGDNPTTIPPRSDVPPALTLDGTSWVVTGGSLDGAAFVPVRGRPATLSVDADHVSGSTGCNTYSGTISIAPDGVTSLSGLVVTEIGCEPNLMEYEQAMLAVLRAVDRVILGADRLRLSTGDGATTLELTAAVAEPDLAIDAVRWQLTAISDGDVVTSIIGDATPFLVVDRAAGAIRGNGGCNDFGGDAVIIGDEITVSDMVSTTMACDEAIMNQEGEFLRILARAATWHVDGGTLTIATGDGDAVTLTAATEPPEATALAWIEALPAGDLDTAASLLAPASFAYVDERGGLAALAAELSEGWGAWARVDDRRAWSVSGEFPDGSPATVVVLVGTVQQEGMIERRAVSILMDEVEGRFFVQPFIQVERIGFVVPRTDVVDRVAPDVPFELAVPESFEVMVFLDDSGPLPTAVVAGAGGARRVTASADPSPEPGEHVLTVIHRTGAGSIGVRSAIFMTSS